MEIIDDKALFKLKNGKNRVLGFDIGSKNIGIAISDPQFLIATPYTTLHRKKYSDFLLDLKKIIGEENIAAFIVGQPFHMNGDAGKASQSIQDFVRQLTSDISKPVLFQDERLTTVAAEKMLIHHDVSRKKRQKVIDKLAATYILQTVLDRLGYIND